MLFTSVFRQWVKVLTHRDYGARLCFFRIPRRAWKSQARRHPHSVIAGTLQALDMHQHLLSCRAFDAYSRDMFIVGLNNVIYLRLVVVLDIRWSNP